MIQVREYVDNAGRNHFGVWRAKLDPTARARIDVALDRLERGNTSAMKSVGAGLVELRLDFGPGYRVYCGLDGETLVILLAGGTKQRQQTDITVAKCFGRNTSKGNGAEMGTTKDFNETVRTDLQHSADYRRAILREAVGCVVSGDVETGKSLLRKYINGTVGFVALGEAVGRSSKTLMQMLSPKGNPTITNFFEIVTYLQKLEGSALAVIDVPPLLPRKSKRPARKPSIVRKQAA